MPYMWFECKSCIISSQLYIHPIIFFKQNPWKKSEDTPANFTLGIYSIFKELLTLLLAQLITQTQDFVLNVNLNTFPQCKTTYNRSTLQKTEQIPDGFLSFRKREKCALEYMNKQCSIDFDHICLRVITLYKKIVLRWFLL